MLWLILQGVVMGLAIVAMAAAGWATWEAWSWRRDRTDGLAGDLEHMAGVCGVIAVACSGLLSVSYFATGELAMGVLWLAIMQANMRMGGKR